MKNLLCLMLLASVILLSCKTAQLYEIKPTSNIKQESSHYVFENDTIKITYSFWEDRGVLSYTLYNKLNIPIYIDWKKCSFIKNGEKLDYWKDEVNSKSISKSRNNIYSAYYYGANVGRNTITNTNEVKPERVIFIAPNSSITREQFVLYPYDFEKIKSNGNASTIISNQDRVIKVKQVKYTESNSPLVFRNFISLSTTENFEKEYYVDNGFYVSSRVQLSKTDFFNSGITLSNPKYFYIKQ